ncbi:hypothetical protein LMG26857_03361 [Achromobacter anxifer]|nr:hypothetical protein LMG26857_03361 [Achromobacter anxifer]
MAPFFCHDLIERLAAAYTPSGQLNLKERP